MEIKEGMPSYAATADSEVSTRITVRLKMELAQRLAAALKEQGKSVTQIVEAALEKHLQPAPRGPKLSLLDALEKNGLLGCVDMGPDASVRVKEEVDEYLAGKYPHH